jgi:hypothetical protein
MLNINEAITKIKGAGKTNVRVVPMAGESIQDGNYQIEVLSENTWSPIVVGMKKNMAENLVSQALNKVICG